MPQDTAARFPTHVAIIVDGNRRWAKQRLMPVSLGHKAGFDRLREITRYAVGDRGVFVLSLYVFSTENFSRDAKEVGYLMDLFANNFRTIADEMNERGCKVLFSGRREGLQQRVLDAMDYMMDLTKDNDKGIVNFCLNYGSHAELTDAMRAMGMQQAMSSQFEGFATNSAFLVSQKTGEAYKGFRKGRWWNLELSDIERLRNGVAEIDIITPSIAYWGRTAVHGDKKYECSVKGVYPEYEHKEHQEMAYGRFINDVDIKEARKVCTIGKRVYEILFHPGEDPCGKYIRVDGIYYQVVGMCSSEGNMNIQGQASEAITLPYTTMKQAYNLGNRIHVACFTVKPGVKVTDIQDKVEHIVKAAHYISPDDKQAVMMLNAEAMFSMVDNLMTGVRILIWMVGLGTLFAGAIGVSNIMMVTSEHVRGISCSRFFLKVWC